MKGLLDYIGGENMEINRGDLPEIKHDRHRAFIIDYLGTYNQVDSYMKIYPNSSRESAMTSSSTLIRRYKEYIDTYHFLKIKEQFDKDKDEAKSYLNPYKAIIEKGKMAFSPDFKYPNIKNEAINDILEMSGGDVLARYIAQEMIKEYGLMPLDKDAEDNKEDKDSK